MCIAQIELQETIMPAKIAIYEPPKEGLPYLIVTFTSDGLNVLTAKSSFEARAVVSERMIRRRRERKSEELSVLASQPA